MKVIDEQLIEAAFFYRFVIKFRNISEFKKKKFVLGLLLLLSF